MLHRDRANHIFSLTSPGSLFTITFVLLAFGYGLFMTRGLTPNLKEVNPEQSQYNQIVPQGSSTSQKEIQLNKQGLKLLDPNADCGYGGLVYGTLKPDMIYAISPEPNSVISPSDKIKIWYNDKFPMMLGKDSVQGPLSPSTSSPPEHLVSPQFGDKIYTIREWKFDHILYNRDRTIADYIWISVSRPTYFPQDENKFPYFPAVFVTDVTNGNAGDAQNITLFPPLPGYPDNIDMGPQPHSPPPPEHIPPNLPPFPTPFPFANKPVELNGTWGKEGDTINTVTRNGINLNLNFTKEFPIISNFKMPGYNFLNRTMEYSTELTWNASGLQYANGSGLLSGHKYRLQFIIRNITGIEIAQGCINYTVQ